MKIVDCFMFFNELDILEIRLLELYDVVDYFVIVEATLTHNNTPKPLYFKENEHRFAKYLDKIIHRVTDFSEHYSFESHIHVPNSNWFRENYQRECCRLAIDELHLNDNDIVLTTDCDEIPKRALVESIRNGTLQIHDGVYSMEMTLYYYTIEHTTPRKWYHAKLINYRTYCQYPLLTMIRFANYILIPNAGYHLSYFGDVQFIKTKVESFAESIDYSTAGKDIHYLQDCYQKGILHFNREQLQFIPLRGNANVPIALEWKESDPADI